MFSNGGSQPSAIQDGLLKNFVSLVIPGFMVLEMTWRAGGWMVTELRWVVLVEGNIPESPCGFSSKTVAVIKRYPEIVLEKWTERFGKAMDGLIFLGGMVREWSSMWGFSFKNYVLSVTSSVNIGSVEHDMVVSKNAGSFKRAPLGVRKGSYPFKKGTWILTTSMYIIVHRHSVYVDR